MDFKPLNDRILVARVEEPTTTASGIIIPDTAKEKPLRGSVLAVGPGRIGDDGGVTPLAVAVGDTIVFGKYAGTELKIDGQERTILREDDVLGVVED
ncbi:MAG: co-chaperone GroES [Myxococcota bacterium]|jgi:chaperonin GroES|nr:co-chaperone GroES [Myxococcota bacterium]